MLRKTSICALVLTATLPALAHAAPARRIVVLDLKAEGGVRENLRSLLNEALLARLADVDGVTVFGPSDIERMLDLEQTRQLMGCDDDGCFAEIGGALGADELIASSMGRIGSRYVINLKLIDTRKAEVRARLSRPLGDSEDALYDGVGDAVDALISEAGLEHPGVASRRWGWVSAGVGGGALIGSAVLLGLASSAAGDARSAGDVGDWRAARGRSEALQWTALGTTAIAAAGGALAWYFFSRGDEPPAPQTLSVAPGIDPDGLSVTLRASW